MVGHEARAAEVDDLDFASAVTADQHVFGLEVAVDQSQLVHKLEALEAFARNLLQARKGEVALGPTLAVELGELVQVVAQQLRDDEQVLLEVEVIVQLQQVVLVARVVSIDVLEDLDLI